MHSISFKEQKFLVLVVDDNPVNIQVVGEHIRKEGIDVSISTSGAKALQIAESRKPDLILLDVMMPGMDGYEVCTKLKENDETKNIPVIFLTAKVSPDSIIEGFSKGAVDYITKPFNSEELMARVKTHLTLKHFKDQIAEQNKKLNLLNVEKNEFLGIAAHDLKNPIYSISMLGKLLRDEPDMKPDEVKEYATDIVTSTERMLELISALLDINAIEQGKVKFHFDNYDIAEIADQTIFQYKERAKSKDITLHINRPDGELKAYCDRNGIVQTLDNLVSNAIKFSPHGKNIYLNIEDAGEDYKIIVKDEGPGISEDDMKKLFGKFTKLSARPTGDEHSTGLGLSIVKQYVENMGGRVWCESTLGQGASFIVKIPKEKNIEE